MNKYILFLGLFFFQIHLLSGNNFINQNRIVKYGIHNGLINNIIFDIDQDKDGYIWFATEEGLSKFNGVDFVNSKWTKAVSSELTSYIAFSVLCEDSILYIGTRSGLVIYNINKDEFKRIVNHSNGPQECNNEIRAIIKKRTGGFWIGTYGGGVFSFDPKTETFNRLNYEYNDKRVLALYEDKNNFLYVGTHFGGMDVIDKKRRLFKRYCQQQRNITDNQVEAIFEDSHGKIWIGTWKGLLMLDKITWNISIFDNEILRKAKINTITQDKSGTIWVGTESFLCNFNPKGYLKQNKTDKVDFIYESESELGLSYKTIRKVFIAKDNNVWIGTYSGGVNFINKLKQKFNYISSKSSAKNTLSDKRVSSISEDKEGNLWVSTDGGGVNFWDKKKQSFTPINSKNTQYNLTDDAILCSFVDSDDEIWLGAYNCILYRKPINSNKFIQYKNEEGNSNSILKSDLTCLYEDSRKNIWIGQRTGLSVFNKSSSQFSIIESLKWYHINHIAEHDGFLIIGTLMGLMKYDYSTNKVEPFRPELKNVFVNTFLFDKNNVLWIGTNGLGLWMYDRKTNKIEIFDEKNGLESNVILSLIELSTGEIWMSTNNSISKISTKTKLIENYNSTDGVQPGMFLRNSALKLSSGLLAFGGY